MCGLTGFLCGLRNQTADQMQTIVGRMAETLHHRGPDDTGVWCQPAMGIALGFKRLSIVDLSQAGHQPMTSSSGRFVIAYNGEVFNHNDLRTELIAKGYRFRGHSDTEVLIEGFSEWGIEATVQRCIGMFAFAVWDSERRELTLARDRLGKKPLYFSYAESLLLFGSETKALRCHPAFNDEIDRKAIGTFLSYSYLPRGSIFRNVRSLSPGTTITFPLDVEGTVSDQRLPIEKPYWSVAAVARAGLNSPFSSSYEEAIEQLDALLTDAVGRRMLADVPLGAFLSGGIDSSLVVALMQKQSSRPVKTFTIGFEEKAYDEAPYAKRVAQHLKTDHTEFYVTSIDARDVIPLLPQLFDEPFADSSQIPTYLVCQLARRDVTVALSGDGGDELFCGYRRYFEALQGFFPPESGTNASNSGLTSNVARLSRALPAIARRAIGRTSRSAGRLAAGRLGRLLSITADLFSDLGPHHRYLRNLTHWHALDASDLGVEMPDLMSTAGDLSRALDRPQTSSSDYQQAWQAFDLETYLPGDILTKVDRASMGVSLEARTPLLDHRVVEFAWSLPHEFKVKQGQGKRILRDLLAKYVPRDLFERPKVGFGVPIDAWLRGPLREWAEELLDEQRLKREGFLNPAPIRRKWKEHLSGRANWQYHLWDVLMFQSWLSSR